MLLPININATSPNFFYQTIASAIINNFQERFLPENISLIPISFYAPLEVYLFISFIIGAAVSFPVALYQIYRFFSPALQLHERAFALKFTASFIGLFSFGLTLGYLYIVPLTFNTMLLFAELLNLSLTYNFADFFSMVGMILLITGLLFTFPIYVYLLVRVGILKTHQLTKNRKYLYGAIFIIIAIVDPDPSLITEIVTFIPIIILMEITILLSKRLEKSRKENTL